ncbi:MAG: V-type ATP synthase subunit D [Phycisphaerae bacterium]|nr:V-type ATP synthase subunit D [Phycisphaerae bacterium]
MAKRKIKLTRTELKAQRDALARYERYLPTLKLKEQQVQSSIVQTRQEIRQVQDLAGAVQKIVDAYQGLFRDHTGVNVRALASPSGVQTTPQSIAGVRVRQFEDAIFPKPDYSLFGTSPWVDRVLTDLRRLNRLKAKQEVLQERLDLLQAELKKVMQRVNLFEKIMIPKAMENIRRIRIAVGDQMTAGVARAKIAKAKLEQNALEEILAGEGTDL